MAKDDKTRGFEPEIVFLYCEHSKPAGGGVNTVEGNRDGFRLKTAMLPCSSKIESPHLLKIIEDGADGVEIIGCPEGGCKFLVGSRRAEKRVDYTRRLLDDIGMGAERVGMLRRGKMTLEQLVEIAGKRADTVRELGPNPMKGAVKK